MSDQITSEEFDKEVIFTKIEASAYAILCKSFPRALEQDFLRRSATHGGPKTGVTVANPEFDKAVKRLEEKGLIHHKKIDGVDYYRASGKPAE